MQWNAKERRVLSGFKRPVDIQAFLDALEYDPRGGAISPRAVLRERKAQCYSGALFAAAALRELGHPARIMWIDAVSDDGHCLALYQQDGLWGSIAKSNFTTLRSREPVYTYLALGLSYFDGGKLLYVDRAIDSAERAWKLPRRAAKHVSNVTEQLRTAGLLGSNAEGLWRPKS